MRGRDKFSKFKPIINLMVKIVSVLPQKMRIKIFYKLRYKKGTIGILKRYIYLKSLSPSCGDNVAVHEGVFLLNPQKIRCGDNVSIHPMCYIDATGNITIGNDVSIAHGTTIMSSTHTYSDGNIPIKDQEVIWKETNISDNVWIGAKSTIIAGVKIHRGCVIGAGGVVTKDCEENSMYVGVPARKIKSRTEE